MTESSFGTIAFGKAQFGQQVNYVEITSKCIKKKVGKQYVKHYFSQEVHEV